MNVLELTFDELVDWLGRHHARGAFHAAAVFRQLYRCGRWDLTAAAEFAPSPQLARRLQAELRPRSGRVEIRQPAGDALKFVTRLSDGCRIESVVLPMERHTTVCVSTQAGCRMGCAFCRTARLGFQRHLTPGEIVGQIWNARRRVDGRIRNVVFMGMGEPLDNFDALVQAIRVANDQRGLDIALRRMTVSTVGPPGGIEKLRDAGLKRLRLAVSLNAPNDELRSRLMPVNRALPMIPLRRALGEYLQRRGGQAMVAYVLLAGVNDADRHARQLARFLAPLPAKVNLIPFNPVSNLPYQAPCESAVQRFAAQLASQEVLVIRRRTRGQDALAACGQLTTGPKRSKIMV